MLTLWSIDGKKVYEEEITNKFMVNIPVQRFQSGVYTVYLTTPENLYSEKIIIHH